MTGTQSRTMPIGELRVLRNAETTLSRLSARVFFWPLPVRMISRSDSASASRSKDSSRFCSASAPMPPWKYIAEPVAHLAVEDLVALEVLDLEVAERVQTSSRRSSSRVRPARGSGFISRSAASRTLRLASALAPSASSSARSASSSLLARLDVGVAARLDLLALDADLGLQRGQVAVALVLVDRGDHVGREVDDLLQVLRRQVEQVAQPARDALEVPDVRDRSGQLDVAHPLTAHLGAGDLDAAALADDALEADPLVLPAVALPVAGRTEDLLAEEPVLLRLEGAVVDGLRLLDLAVATTDGCRQRWPGRCARFMLMAGKPYGEAPIYNGPYVD